jgi:hypothetical protein
LTGPDAANVEFYMICPEKRLALGIEMCLAFYDRVKFPVQVTNGEQVNQMNARVENCIANVFLSARYFLKTEGPFLPYVNTKAGVSDFSSNLYLEDGGDKDGCPGMESAMLNCSSTFAMSVGGGVKADLGYLFKMPKQMLLLDFGVNYVGGGSVNYLSPNAPVNTSDKEIPVAYDEYFKTDEGTVHVDHVGNRYHSNVSMLISAWAFPSGRQVGNALSSLFKQKALYAELDRFSILKFSMINRNYL